MSSTRRDLRRRAVLLSTSLLVAAGTVVAAGSLDLAGATVKGGETCSAVTPNYRAADTRNGTGGVPVGKIGIAGTLNVTVAGVGGVPAGATSVKIQLTATELTGIDESFLVAYPAGSARPPSSNLNPVDDHTSSNGAQPVDVGINRQITIYNDRGSTHVVVDVVEWCDDHTHDYPVGDVETILQLGQHSTPSTSYVNVPATALTVNTASNGRLLVTFSSQVLCKDNGPVPYDAWCLVQVLVDGTPIQPDRVIYATGDPGPNAWSSRSHQFVSGPLAGGPHLVQPRYRVDEATAVFNLDQTVMTVLPLAP